MPKKFDTKRLTPTQLAQLLNSTALGQVITSRWVRNQRSEMGLRFGDGETIDLERYVAWMLLARHSKSARGDAYQRKRAKSVEKTRTISTIGRDIGELPEVQKPRRRGRARRSFKYFCERYFPAVFALKWSPDHLRVIEKIERAVLQGGQFAMAMPRGAGKTSLCDSAVIWAMVFGHRRFVVVVGPDEGHASDRVDAVKTQLETNDNLAADFPEVCYPVRKLEGVNQRRLLYKGALVRVQLSAKQIMLPVLDGSAASGAIFAAAGITGQVRGKNATRPDDGEVMRPEFVIVDDPQTDQSAHSPSQCFQRERTLNGAILGLGGPRTKIAAVLPCTVVRADDLADRVLDREINPQWQGERTKMVYRWPERLDLWEQYTDMRRSEQREERGHKASTSFYRRNRKEMDRGAELAWPQRKNSDEITGLQHAYNIRCDRGDAAFFAEYQNDPLPEVPADEELLTPQQVAKKTNGHGRCVIPATATILTAMIDVSQKVLWYMVCAWEPDFTGYVVDYGTEPGQKREYFGLADIKIPLATVAPGADVEGQIYAGLSALSDRLLDENWRRDDGAVMRIERLLIDARWGRSTPVVRKFCRQSRHGAIAIPSMGEGVTAAKRPLNEAPRKKGDRAGLNWKVPAPQAANRVRHVLFDANYWKTTIHQGLGTPMGDQGCLSLFEATPDQHRMVSEQIASEYRVRTEGRGRSVDEWFLKIPGSDNHFLDTLVGCAVGASMSGAAPSGIDPEPMRKPSKRVSFAAMQRRARERRKARNG